jgi:hypothetical protein
LSGAKLRRQGQWAPGPAPLQSRLRRAGPAAREDWATANAQVTPLEGAQTSCQGAGPLAAIDPGRSKCGLVISDPQTSAIVVAAVLPPDQALARLRQWQDQHLPLKAVLLGNGTGSGAWRPWLAPIAPLLVVPEAGTTLAARHGVTGSWNRPGAGGACCPGACASHPGLGWRRRPVADGAPPGPQPAAPAGPGQGATLRPGLRFQATRSLAHPGKGLLPRQVPPNGQPANCGLGQG